MLRIYSTSYPGGTQFKDYIILFLKLRLCDITIGPFSNSDCGNSGGHLDVFGDSHDRSSGLLVIGCNMISLYI